MTEKKVLIIAYYWPPSGGSGVQRWLKFVKYLPKFGVLPYVFTPANPSFAIKDESLLNDVPTEAEIIRFPIWEPYNAFSKLSKVLKPGARTATRVDHVNVKNKSTFQKVSTWIRGNFFIPDPRVFWVRPSVKFLHDFIQNKGIQTIITTGPPHSVHLIGYKLKQKNSPLHWIADFRDPWSEWGFLDSLNVGVVARAIHKRLESNVLSTADKVITITPFYVRRFEQLANRKVHLLTNGFDEDDFNAITYRKGEKFLIRHVGIINEKCDPRPFMEAVTAVMKNNSDFRSHVAIEFIGEVHPHFKAYVGASAELLAVTKFTGNVPHKQLIATYGDSSLLVLILTGYKDAEGYMPGKLFEYLATSLPVLAVGPTQGDAAAFLQETQAGYMIDSNDGDGIVNALEMSFENWKNLPVPIIRKTGSLTYSRRMITSKLADLIV